MQPGPLPTSPCPLPHARPPDPAVRAYTRTPDLLLELWTLQALPFRRLRALAAWAVMGA